MNAGVIDLIIKSLKEEIQYHRTWHSDNVAYLAGLERALQIVKGTCVDQTST